MSYHIIIIITTSPKCCRNIFAKRQEQKRGCYALIRPARQRNNQPTLQGNQRNTCYSIATVKDDLVSYRFEGSGPNFGSPEGADRASSYFQRGLVNDAAAIRSEQLKWVGRSTNGEFIYSHQNCRSKVNYIQTKASLISINSLI